MWLMAHGSTYYPKQTSPASHSPHGEHHSPGPPDNVMRTFGSEWAVHVVLSPGGERRQKTQTARGQSVLGKARTALIGT